MSLTFLLNSKETYVNPGASICSMFTEVVYHIRVVPYVKLITHNVPHPPTGYQFTSPVQIALMRSVCFRMCVCACGVPVM